MTVLTIIAGIIQVFSCLFLIVFVLLHSGRGSGVSSLFGGGGAMSGGTVVEKNLDRITLVTVAIFAVTTVFLGLRLG
jgi:preprotein translocase subunit SecG